MAAIAVVTVFAAVRAVSYDADVFFGMAPAEALVVLQPDGELSVSAVAPDSPAARTGLLEGDIISSIDGSPVNDIEAVLDVLSGIDPGRRFR